MNNPKNKQFKQPPEFQMVQEHNNEKVQNKYTRTKKIDNITDEKKAIYKNDDDLIIVDIPKQFSDNKGFVKKAKPIMKSKEQTIGNIYTNAKTKFKLTKNKEYDPNDQSIHIERITQLDKNQFRIKRNNDIEYRYDYN